MLSSSWNVGDTNIKTDASTMVPGRLTEGMEKVRSHGRVALCIKVLTKMTVDMAKEQ